MNEGQSKGKYENIIVKNIAHNVQTDFSICVAWALCVLHGIVPKAFVATGY